MTKHSLVQVPYPLGNLEGPGEIGRFGFAVQGLSALETIISWIIGIMTVMAGLWFIFLIITAAYQWMSAGGDKNKLQEAHQKLLNAFIGLTVVVAAYAIVSLVGYVLEFNILNPAELLGEMWS